MSRSVQIKAYITRNGRVPFVEQFGDLDKDAARSVTQRLEHDVRVLRSGANHVGKKLSGYNLWQTGSIRDRGASTRVLFRRWGDTIVVFGVFVKTENADNRRAIARQLKDFTDLEEELEKNPDALEDRTDLLCIEPTRRPREPWRARTASADTDIGVFADGFTFAAEDTEVVEAEHAAPEDWLDAREAAQTERAQIVADAGRDNQITEQTAERFGSRATLRAKRDLARSTGRAAELVERQWTHPPFRVSELIDWMALDEEIAYLEAIGIPEEQVRNVEAKEEFERQRKVELAALETGATKMRNDPKYMEGHAARQQYKAERLAEREKYNAAATAFNNARQKNVSRAAGRRWGRKNIPKVETIPVDPFGDSKEELNRWKKEVAQGERDYALLEEVEARLTEVAREEFHPSRWAERRLKTARETRNNRIASIGADVIASSYPAVKTALPMPPNNTEKGPRKVRPSSSHTRAAALVTRAAWEHGLGIVGTLLEGFDVDRHLADPNVRAAIIESAQYQKKRGIAVGKGFPEDVATVATEPELMAAYVPATIDIEVLEGTITEEDLDDIQGPDDPGNGLDNPGGPTTRPPDLTTGPSTAAIGPREPDVPTPTLPDHKPQQAPAVSVGAPEPGVYSPTSRIGVCSALTSTTKTQAPVNAAHTRRVVGVSSVADSGITDTSVVSGFDASHLPTASQAMGTGLEPSPKDDQTQIVEPPTVCVDRTASVSSPRLPQPGAPLKVPTPTL